MNTQPTIETVMQYLREMDTRFTTRLDRIEEQLKLMNRKLDLLAKSNLDHEARIEALEETTREITRPMPRN